MSFIISALLYALVATAIVAASAIYYSVLFPLQPLLEPLPPATEAQRRLAVRLHHHVRAIASKPHNVAHYDALNAAADYIESQLRDMGHHIERQVFDTEGHEVRNIEVVIEPRVGSNGGDSIVVGAHYDSAGDSPGANDNGSGVAALLELAREFIDVQPKNVRLRLVFYVNEEQPYSRTEFMGSWRHARRLSESGEKVRGMFALETLGYFSSDKGSQKFPFPFDYIYSDVGNFVAFVGLPGARAFVRRSLGLFRQTRTFPSIGGVVPSFIEGSDLSDHWSYHQFGFPAFMITDTAPYRNPRYHSPYDLPATVDYESLARITTGLAAMVRGLTNDPY